MLLEAFLLEIDLYRTLLQKQEIVSCYFGGGTPYLFGARRFQRLFQALNQVTTLSNTAEITLEINPEHVQFQELQELNQLGFNRVSFGVQSFHDSQLKLLGRSHSREQVDQALSKALRAGFSNLSIDLMYDLPQSSLALWKRTLEQATSLPITHLSLYNLSIEPNTPFWKKKALLEKDMPSDIDSSEGYSMAISSLQEAGFHQYEISAFSKRGFESRHNIGYWIGHPYLGFGPSASSFYSLYRFTHLPDLRRYSKSITNNLFHFESVEELEHEKRINELIAVGLRYLPGVNLDQIEAIVGAFVSPSTQRTIAKLKELGLLVEKPAPHTIQLTERGLMVYDTVASEII